jgi:hypothetical protein
MPRSNYLAAQVYLATGQPLAIVNSGYIQFTITADLPFGMGIQTWRSAMHPDGSLTFLGMDVR